MYDGYNKLKVILAQWVAVAASHVPMVLNYYLSPCDASAGYSSKGSLSLSLSLSPSSFA